LGERGIQSEAEVDGQPPGVTVLREVCEDLVEAGHRLVERGLGYEEVTKDIHLTGPDTFEATGTFDLFIAGKQISPEEGCPFSEAARRFE
jgi:hypothetical protein